MRKRTIHFLFFLIIKISFAQQTIPCHRVEMVTMKDGKIQNKITNEYDKFGNEISVSTYTYYTSNPVIYTVKNQYNSKNNLVKTSNFLNDKLLNEVNHQLDQSGNQNSFLSINQNGKTTQSSVFENGQKIINNFDENGGIFSTEKTIYFGKNKSSISRFNDKNNLVFEEKFVYNAEDMLISAEKRDFLANIKINTKTTYNNLKLPVLVEEIVNDKLNSSTVFEYNLSGKTQKFTKFNSKNEEEFRVELEYTNGLETATKSYYLNKLVSIKQKYYDEKNNLIKETQINKVGQIISETFYKYSCQ